VSAPKKIVEDYFELKFIECGHRIRSTIPRRATAPVAIPVPALPPLRPSRAFRMPASFRSPELARRARVPKPSRRRSGKEKKRKNQKTGDFSGWKV
jgi:hypothetical protein